MLIHNLNKPNQFPFEIKVEKGPLHSERNLKEGSIGSANWSKRSKHATENSMLL